MRPADVGAAAHVIRDDAPLTGDDITIDGEEGHHLHRVLRLRPGQLITVADGMGSWRAFTVTDADGGIVHAEQSGPREMEPVLVPALTIAFALTKGDKPELVVQKLTELGVDRICPVVAQRSIVRWDDSRAAHAVERWRRVAREAAGQCRRARLPVIEPLQPLTALTDRPDLLIAEPGGGPVSGLPRSSGWTVLIGPEGGFAPPELELLDTPSRRPRISLGSYVLRAETAAIAAATLLGAARAPRG